MITWITDLAELPRKEAPQFFLANEFFDALPIQKFQVLWWNWLKNFYLKKLDFIIENSWWTQRTIGGC